MLDALQHRLKVDAFVIYTDSETWAGQIHPSQALDMYHQQTDRHPGQNWWWWA